MRRCKRCAYSAFDQIVARMTGRQRIQWARAGYPGLKERDVEPLYAFVPRERVENAAPVNVVTRRQPITIDQ